MVAPCPNCNGSGYINGTVCSDCNGDGETNQIHLVIASKVQSSSQGILDKCDAIIAEQALQRVDLTAVLTQIWNKVKNL